MARNDYRADCVNKMGNLKIGWLAAGLLAVAVAVVAALAYARFRRDMRAASERVAQGGHIIETECGLIEHGTAGTGTPVLVIHGAGGGYDQGLLIGSQMLGGISWWDITKKSGLGS